MRSKTVAKDKVKAPSALQSATITKKRGRPSKADIAAREAAAQFSPDAAPVEKKKRGRPAKIKAEAVSPSETARPVPTAPKKSARPKKADLAWENTFLKIQHLLALGAVHIKLDGVEVAIPTAQIAAPNGFSHDYSETEKQISQMAKVAPMDNPDEYAEAQDRWANHEPMPRI